MDINKAFTTLLNFEGGLANVKNDAGGLTKYGISQRAYPNLNITTLTEDKAKAIYGTDYWLAAACPKLKPELQYIHFDTAVNMGVSTAIRLLQQAIGIKDDGLFGPETLVKSDNISPAQYLLHRLARYTLITIKNPSQLAFLSGWAHRTMQLMQLSRTGQLK